MCEEHDASFVWFTDEKKFTVEFPVTKKTRNLGKSAVLSWGLGQGVWEQSNRSPISIRKPVDND